MAELNGTQHFFFGQLVSFGFHHHHGVFGAGDNQVQTLLGVRAQVIHILDRRVQDVFAVREANACASNRTHEGNARQGQSSRSSDHRNDVGVVHQIVAQHGAHHQNFVLEARDEQRADRTIDQTRGQGLFFRGTRFALEEATGDLTGCVVFFLIVDGQGKEVLTRLCLFGKGHVRHNRGLTQGGDHGTVCLAGNLTGFQREGLFAPLHRFFEFVEHQRILAGSSSKPSWGSRLHGGPIAADLNHHSLSRCGGLRTTSQIAPPYTNSVFGERDRLNTPASANLGAPRVCCYLHLS